jgi:hypothetical protein
LTTEYHPGKIGGDKGMATKRKSHAEVAAIALVAIILWIVTILWILWSI